MLYRIYNCTSGIVTSALVFEMAMVYRTICCCSKIKNINSFLSNIYVFLYFIGAPWGTNFKRRLESIAPARLLNLLYSLTRFTNGLFPVFKYSTTLICLVKLQIPQNLTYPKFFPLDIHNITVFFTFKGTHIKICISFSYCT